MRTLAWESPGQKGNLLIKTLKIGGDCHTSDIGHWFAMTGFSTGSPPLLFGKGGVLSDGFGGFQPALFAVLGGGHADVLLKGPVELGEAEEAAGAGGIRD